MGDMAKLGTSCGVTGGLGRGIIGADHLGEIPSSAEGGMDSGGDSLTVTQKRQGIGERRAQSGGGKRSHRSFSCSKDHPNGSAVKEDLARIRFHHNGGNGRALQGHTGYAVPGVHDDQSHGTGVGGVFRLIGEGNLAPLDHGQLVFHIDALVVLFTTGSVDPHGGDLLSCEKLRKGLPEIIGAGIHVDHLGGLAVPHVHVKADHVPIGIAYGAHKSQPLHIRGGTQ